MPAFLHSSPPRCQRPEGTAPAKGPRPGAAAFRTGLRVRQRGLWKATERPGSLSGLGLTGCAFGRTVPRSALSHYTVTPMRLETQEKWPRSPTTLARTAQARQAPDQVAGELFAALRWLWVRWPAAHTGARIRPDPVLGADQRRRHEASA